MELLVKGSRIIDFSSDFVGDIYIKDGIIESIGKNIIKDCKVIKGEGLVLLPSFVDLHAHFRDPGQFLKEDLVSGSKAAVKGGFTGVNLMANTKPVCSNMEIVRYVKEKVKEIGLVDVHQSVSVTKDMDGIDLGHLDFLDRSIKFISDDGKGVINNEIMLLAMQKAAALNIGVISHAEFEELNKYDTRLSENLMTKRDIELANYTGCHLHVAHVSTKEAMEEIIKAKMQYNRITCEVTPHHLALADSDYRVNPPIRSEKDVEFLINAIKNGWIDAIGTDHAPHTKEDKLNGAPGISGIETAFSVCYTKLVVENNIGLNKLSELMSKNPSQILGFNKGQISIGYDGDLVLVDLNKKYKINTAQFVSKGKNTPFDGMEFYGEVQMTIKGGKIVYIIPEFNN
jgi:dihydroorotase